MIHKYSVLIQETHLDLYGHVNNATYMTLFEEARWDWITANGYGLKKIVEIGLGPIILEVNMRFLKELKARDQILIESQMISYNRKIGRLKQTMQRKEDLCCAAEFTIGLFDMKARKLVPPTPEWLAALNL